MTFQRTLVLLSTLVWALNLTAQASEELPIQTIKFEGLKKTQVSFAKEKIHSRIGQYADEKTIAADVQNLKNISGIGNANYRLDTLSSGIVIVFNVEEVKTLLPIVKFGNLTNNVWFQIGFVDINWQGKGQTFSAYYQNNDQRHSGQIYYRVPNYKDSQWGYTASLTKWSSREPLFFPEGTVLYDYDNNSVALTGIRQFGLQRSIEFGGTYFIEKYSKSENQFLETTPGPTSLRQPKLLGKIEYQTNKINYDAFYLTGHSWYSTLQNVYNTIDKSWFHSLEFQGKKFLKLGSTTNLALRLRLAVSTNNDSPFAPFVADNHVNLRGVGNRIDRGTAQVVINAEFRQTLFHTDKWAAQAVTFSDLGTWRNPGGQLADILDREQFRQFVGGGVRFIYKKVYGAVLRIDYGIDVFNTEQRGLVIGLGQYF